MMDDPFHRHLDVCARCRARPFDLCPDGAHLLANVVGLDVAVDDRATPALLLAEELLDRDGSALVALRALRPGHRVRYSRLGGKDAREGTFVAHVFGHGGQAKYEGRAGPLHPNKWGNSKHDFVLVKRDFSADDGRALYVCAAVDPDTVRRIR